MNILIVVHGRFHAFDLARALIRDHHEVTVFTGLPPSKYEPFGLTKQQTRTYWLYGAIEKLTRKLPERVRQRIEMALKTAFSRWALRQYQQLPTEPDAIYCFSGVALEMFSALGGHGAKLLARGSAHILEQKSILTDAFDRHLGEVPAPGPESYAHDWMIKKELREYDVADAIITQSTFALTSFRSRGFEKSRLMRSASDNTLFSIKHEILEQRAKRIRSKEPLRILTVGEFSVRKGAFELAEISNRLSEENMTFRFIGSVAANCAALSEQSQWINFLPRVNHFELSTQYDWADVFLFPTLEDGFAAVVAQAYAQGLPLIATRNCGAFDMMESPRDGEITDAGDVASMIGLLKYWESEREVLAGIAEAATSRRPLTWKDTADQLTEIVQQVRNG